MPTNAVTEGLLAPPQDLIRQNLLGFRVLEIGKGETRTQQELLARVLILVVSEARRDRQVVIDKGPVEEWCPGLETVRRNALVGSQHIEHLNVLQQAARLAVELNVIRTIVHVEVSTTKFVGAITVENDLCVAVF